MAKMGRPAVSDELKRRKKSTLIEQNLLDQIMKICDKNGITFSSYMQEAARDSIKNPGSNLKKLLKGSK